MKKVAVIGGGISGIAAAYYLQKSGFSVDVYESSDRIGGRIGSESVEGRWLDFGGKNIGKKYTRFRNFVAELGELDFEYFGFSTSQVINGRVVRINKEKSQLANLLRVFSLAGLSGIMKLMPMVREVRKERDQGFLNTPYFNGVADRFDEKSLALFFPKGCAAHLIRPLTVRMNGAEPEECYPGNFGSNLSLALDSYEQLRQSMQGMIGRFREYARSVEFFTGHHVTALERRNGETVLHVACNNEKLQKSYSKVLVALPAVQAASLFRDALPELAELLGQVRYYPVAIALAKYQQDVFSGTQRAMVFDSACSLSNAGAYGIHDLDLVRYTFSGHTARKVIGPETKPEESIALAEELIAPYFRIRGNRRENFVYRYLSPGLCAYSQYHYRLLSKMNDIIDRVGNIGLTGDYWRGASIEACFRSASEGVQKLIDRHHQT